MDKTRANYTGDGSNGTSSACVRSNHCGNEPVLYIPDNVAITSTAFNRFCGRFPRGISPLANISFYATNHWARGGRQIMKAQSISFKETLSFNF